METTNKDVHESISIKQVAKEVLISLILAFGSLLIEGIKKLFGEEGPPYLLLIILNIIEVTLALSFGFAFIVALIRGLNSIFVELDKLAGNVTQSRIWTAVKSIRLGQPSKMGILKAISYGLTTGLVIAVFTALTLLIQNLPTVWLWVGLILLFGYVLFSFFRVLSDAGPLGIAVSVFSVVGILLALVIGSSTALVLILRLAGRPDLLNLIVAKLLSH
jgi:hypothetical protein